MPEAPSATLDHEEWGLGHPLGMVKGEAEEDPGPGQLCKIAILALECLHWIMSEKKTLVFKAVNLDFLSPYPDNTVFSPEYLVPACFMWI